MKQFYKPLLLLLISIATVFAASAQITVEITVKSIYNNYSSDGDDDYGGRFRFFYNREEENCSYILNADCSCIQTGNKLYSGDPWLALKNIYLPAGTTTFNIFMRTHHERQHDCTSHGSTECRVDNLGCGHPDLHDAVSSQTVNLADYMPGVQVPLFTMTNIDGVTTASAVLLIRYTITKPTTPTAQNTVSDPNTHSFCANNSMELGTNVLPSNIGLRYEWQYALQNQDVVMWNPDKDPRNYYDSYYGACGHWEYDWSYPDGQYFVYAYDCDLPDYITTHNWQSLAITNPNTERKALFTPLQAVFNNNLSSSQNVLFQVRAISSENRTSVWSDAGIYNFLPAPPTIIEANLIKKPSCISPPNGRIIIPYNAINSSFTKTRWLLKNGFVDAACKVKFNDNGTISSDCGNIEKQSDGPVNVPKSASDAPIIIDSLPKGDYTLWMINSGEGNGFCYTPIPITIVQYPELTLSLQYKKDASCFNYSDGVIRLKAGGGDSTSGYQFKVTTQKHPELNTEFTTIVGNVFELNNLPADEYQVRMQNDCSPPIDTKIIITEPILTKGGAMINQPTCYYPANGSVVVDVTDGMGTYTYQLWKDSVKVKEQAGITDVHYVFDELLPGDYVVKALDAARVTCPGFDSALNLIAPPVLTAVIQQTDSVTCYGGGDGAVQITGGGGTGHHIYTLKNNAGTVVASNTNGAFSALTAGMYQLILSKPANEICSDTFVLPVNIPQRAPLAAPVTVIPVTCFGMDDGIVSVHPSGGSGFYAYYWEVWNGTAWQHNNFWFSTDTDIKSLPPGKYRVLVTDTKSPLDCKIQSQEIEVIEPALLQITNVQPSDAACRADGGRIDITVTGGNGGYVYYYSLGNMLHYVAFTKDTPIAATGLYYVKVIDAKGCTVLGDQTYSVDLPPVPMDFTMQASDYEGTSVSCYEGNNGIVTVTATGGSKSGYLYAVNGGAYQPSAVFGKMAASTYDVSVKDLRGCVVTKNITLTQPAQPIQGTITNLAKVYCSGTATGSFTVEAQNGHAPYQYSIDNGATWAVSNSFDKLYTGMYHVVVKDKYDCRWTTDVTLGSVIPPVVYNNTIKNVSCFNGNDGAISVIASGGQAPYQYSWMDRTNITTQVANLTAGEYVLRVIDGAGCTSWDTVRVAQPIAPLAAVTVTQPVCIGSNGSIIVKASGGTAPYSYSANNGSTYQANNVLSNLAPGTYNIVIKDINNCEAKYAVVMSPANAMPEVNFLVASGKNALDTLVIREVSMPVPDSVQWSFDPAAQVIENGLSPRIRFATPGNYWVSMTGFFKGCAYSIRKTLTINPYDPAAGLVYTPPVKVIDTVVIYPNPNSGQFAVHVGVNKKQKLVILVQDMGTGRELVRRIYDPVLTVDDQFALGNVSNGTYVLRVIAENDSRDVLFIINR